jgi:hypothetical protein
MTHPCQLEIQSDAARFHFVACKKCGARGPTTSHSGVEVATARWNDRAATQQAADMVVGLEAELARVKAERDELNSRDTTQTAELIVLRVELAALRRDKERLDWLEKRGLCFRHADQLADETGDDRWADWIVHPDTEFSFGDARAAIDAAMKGGRDE